ncbi:MAG TPA: response regulator [Oligoflexus sp.]|uniref:response regulator n=1 Tax=Oligoflexus sp. TaxID=1971216 RepID=UPI002D6EE634|nr:response regulator [Oligoflexus sp.]HYX35973.1 response regulator [Oligoflexus sp.]
MFSKPYLMVMVDDEQDLSEILAEYVEDMFPRAFAITAFQDPEAALAFIDKNPVRIVVTDVRMPRLNGDQVNLRVKQMGRGIKTLIITGNMSYTKAVTCYNDGADAFIQKPFNPTEIRTTFQRVLDCMESWENVFRKIAHTKAS